MKSKKKIFNKHLYIDGLKQLKMIGIMSLIIICLSAFLIPNGNNISSMDNYRAAASSTTMVGGIGIMSADGPTSTFTVEKQSEIYTLISLNPLLFALMLLVTPLMVLVLFNFLNKRNASDFYHSIPDTRECLFLSYFASIMTWVITIIVSSSLVAIISAACMEFVAVNISTIFTTMFGILAGCVLISGGVLTAMSLSGTTFSNILVSGMILFVPRIIITFFLAISAQIFPFLAMEYGNGLLNGSWNILTGLFTTVFIYSGDAEAGITAIPSIIYTMVLGLIWLAIGCALFKKRHSEVATCPAVNSKLQSIFRLIPAFVICMIPSASIVSDIFNNRNINGYDIYVWIVGYIVAIIVYFLYELFTTRKWKNVIKSIPRLGYLVVLTVGFMLALSGYIKLVSKDVPAASSIQSVNIYNNFEQRYFRDRISETELESPEIKEMISRKLAEEVSEWEKGTGDYYSGYHVTVKINKKSGDIYRRINFNQNEYLAFANVLLADEACAKAYFNLPEIGKSQTTVTLESYAEATTEQLNDLYKTYVEEVNQMSLEDYYRNVVNDGYYRFSGGNPATYIYVATTIGSESYSLNLPITMNTPKTYDKYIQLSQSKEDINPITELLKTETNMQNLDIASYVSFEVYADNSQRYGSAEVVCGDNGYTDYTANGRLVLEELAKKLDESKVANSKSTRILYMTYNEDRYQSSYDKTIVKWYEIDEDTLELINQFINYNGNVRY